MEANNVVTATSVYVDAIHKTLPRVFSMLDRERLSKTFGCADRVFWSWKFIDFPGARFQEIAYLLAELAVNPALLIAPQVEPSIILQWTKAAINFWKTRQHRDGSFDEAYPYERSLAATAFTCFYVGQAFLKVKKTYSTKEQMALIHVFSAAGKWLCRNDERHGLLSNHLAAAAAALNTIAIITDDLHYTKRANYFIDRILEHQSEEGWYEEYGGADPGYQTHTTFYLAYVWTQTKEKKLLRSLEKSIQYFWNFVHTDGSVGGEYGSRNTRFYMPAGFEMLASDIPEAAAVANFMRQSLNEEQVVGLHAMDTYNIFPLINNYCFAHTFRKALNQTALLPLPFHSIGTKKYDQSGHLIILTPNYQAIIATSKGGALVSYSKKEANTTTSWSNAGIVLELSNGQKTSSQGLGCSHIKHADDSNIEIESQFTSINQMLMSPEKFIVFRLVSLLSIPFPFFAYHLKNSLVKVLVRRKKPHPIRLLRKITWDHHGLSISDKLSLDKPQKIINIQVGGRFSAIHMGSSRYFEWQELTHDVGGHSLSVEQIKELNVTGTLTINHNWSIK